MGMRSSQFELLKWLRLSRKQLLPYSKYETAIERANERRANVQKELDGAGDAGYLRQEFLEIPPNILNVETKSFADTLPEAFGQTARLKWQLSANELLLLERVIDAIVAFKRKGTSNTIENDLYAESVSVKIEYLGSSFRKRGLFPWKVVIETDNPAFYIEALHSLEDWLGIGVDLAPAQSIELFGQCLIPQGMEGIVGGIIVGQEEYGMTCEHVISSSCHSLVLKGDPKAGGDQPDAALINSWTSCFNVAESRNHKRVVSSAPSPLIESCIINKTKIINLNTDSGCTGFIIARVGAFAVKKVLYRFPHLQIMSNRLLLGFITVPFLYKYFSKRGDSGSWLSDIDTESWIGMIVGGSKKPPLCYAAEAEPLLDYFDMFLSQKNPRKRSKLIPYKFI